MLRTHVLDFAIKYRRFSELIVTFRTIGRGQIIWKKKKHVKCGTETTRYVISWQPYLLLLQLIFRIASKISYTQFNFKICLKLHKQSHTFIQILSNSTNKSPSWEAGSCSSFEEIPRLSRNSELHYHIRNNPPLEPVLSHICQMHALTDYVAEINSNIILPTTPRSFIYPQVFRILH